MILDVISCPLFVSSDVNIFAYDIFLSSLFCLLVVVVAIVVLLLCVLFFAFYVIIP